VADEKPEDAAMFKIAAAAAVLVALLAVGPLAAQEPKILRVGDSIAVSDACSAEGHAQMTAPSVTASRQQTLDTLARLRSERLCFRFAEAQVIVLEIAAPLLVERLGEHLFGFRFRHLDRDLWAAYYEAPAPAP
jgi:hypothetical protein